MSLFGSLMRDMEQDPIFGAHQRAMNRMMDSFFPSGPVPPMGISRNMPGMRHPLQPHHEQQQLTNHHNPYGHDELMPFGGGMLNPFGFGGFPDMSMMFNMNPANNGQAAFSSSSFVSISSGPDGRPQVYQASAESRQGPDGLRETRKTLSDSRTGTKKMAVGRHLGERAHVVEREQNVRTGQLNENHEFFNLEEEEAPHFDREWRQRATHGLGGRYAHSSSMPAITSSSHTSVGSSSQPSYVEEEPTESEGYPQAAIGYEPQHSQSAVTIEELPASDDEAEHEQLQQQSRSAARRSYPQATTSSAPAASPAPTSARRSPYGTSKEKRLKRSRLAKKF